MSTDPARRARRRALLVGTLPLLAACTSGVTAGGDGAGDAACAATIVYDGGTYTGHGGLERDPALTGRTVTGTLPGCDDSGGQEPASPDEQVQVAEIVGVPVETAFRWNDAVLVRDGRELPPEAGAWFRAPRCTTASDFRLVADWLGVTGPRKPRFDGDLRPPYRLGVHVTDGPARYVGATVDVHADATTEPLLGPADVQASLWQGGEVVARVRCEGGRFRALSLRVPSPR